jgi:AraC family transcriptional regulator
MTQIVQYIREHLGDRIKLDDMARMAGLSPAHFVRKFRIKTGCSPHQWILEQRLSRAEELLKRTDLSITEIAYQIGFADQSHLTRLFRRSRGVTPHQFRESGLRYDART